MLMLQVEPTLPFPILLAQAIEGMCEHQIADWQSRRRQLRRWRKCCTEHRTRVSHAEAAKLLRTERRLLGQFVRSQKSLADQVHGHWRRVPTSLAGDGLHEPYHWVLDIAEA